MECGKECKSLLGLTTHLRACSLSPKEYYDKYFKKDGEEICNLDKCNKIADFQDIGIGYTRYCCKSHSKIGKKRPIISKIQKEKFKDPEFLKRHIKTINRDDVKKRRSESLKQAWKNPEVRERYLQGRKKTLKNKLGHEKQRQWMLNGGASYVSSFNTSPSKPQVELYHIVKEIFSTAVIEYPIIKYNFNIDIAIPKLKIAIEYDGSYWHQDSKKDNSRQDILEKDGWKFIRYKDEVPSKEQIINDMNKFLWR